MDFNIGKEAWELLTKEVSAVAKKVDSIDCRLDKIEQWTAVKNGIERSRVNKKKITMTQIAVIIQFIGLIFVAWKAL